MSYFCYWIEGSKNEDWIYAATKRQAVEKFFKRHGEQDIYYAEKEVMD